MKFRTRSSQTDKPRQAAESSIRGVADGEITLRRPGSNAGSGILPKILLLALMLSTTVRAQFSYNVVNDGITITRYTGTGGVVTIPEAIDGLPVTAIEDLVFTRYLNVTHISVPASVTNIATQAFMNCPGLINIAVDEFNPAYCSIDGVVFTRDQSAIVNCPQGRIGDYTIPGSVTRILDLAFSGCRNLSNIVIPDSVTTIGHAAFGRCTGLAEAVIPNSVASIGDNVFTGCSGLRSITIPGSITSIGKAAFSGCTSLARVDIPDGVTSMGERIFSGCSSLANIAIPEGITSIPTSAFADCTSLSDVTIPGSVASIESLAFSGCGSLTNIAIPNSVANIGGWAFSGCISLDDVMIPRGVTRIGIWAFEQCRSLTHLELPSSMRSIESWAFYRCTSLRQISIPNSITNIGAWSFSGCVSLASVTIPASVKGIGSVAFSGCTSLTGVQLLGDSPAVASDAFSDSDFVTIYYLPGTTGWMPTYAGRPTASWLLPEPVILTTARTFGVHNDSFSFRISWATNATVTVEASGDLENSDWSSISTETLKGGWSQFIDPEWLHHPSRIYRVRSP